MIQIHVLEQWCNQQLNPTNFTDYCPNGLQIEGERPIARLATGVTASLDLIQAAIDWQADALLVHHGYFWRGESSPITGMKGQRIRTLMQNGISLFGYHLPLDAHPLWGNNAQLGQRLGLNDPRPTDKADGLLWQGELTNPLSPEVFAGEIAQALSRQPLLIEAGNRQIETVGWCTGGAQKFIDDAADLHLDAFISGEVSESTVYTARERDIHYFAAGHHATERYGVQALGEQLANTFGIEHRYFEIDNPV